MRHLLALLLLICLLPACPPTLGDDDDSVGDDDDSVGDDDDSVGDDDDSTPPPPGGPSITFGYSFGECWGECLGAMVVPFDGGAVSLVLSNWDGSVLYEAWGGLYPEGLEVVMAASERVDLETLEPVYGCPDCADGGARSITWERGPVAVGTSYEYGNPPDVLAELHTVLADLETVLRGCVADAWFEWIECSDGGVTPGGGP